MKRASMIAGFSLFGMLLSGVVYSQQGSSALLTSVTGGVQVVRGGRTTPAKVGMKLLAGDTVRVTNGTATIFYDAKPPQVLKTGQQAKITGGGGGAGAWRNAYAGLASGFDRRSEEIQVAMRSSKKAALVSPVGGRVLTPGPVFVWEPLHVEDAKVADYLVTVSDARGETVWQGTTKGTLLEYPASAPALKPAQKYTWYVTPREQAAGEPEAMDESASKNGVFEIATPEQAAAMRTEIDDLRKALTDVPAETRRLVEAAAYARGGFATDAIAALTPQITAEVIAKGMYPSALSKTLTALDEPSRVLLRSLYVDTKQGDLVKKLDEVKP